MWLVATTLYGTGLDRWSVHCALCFWKSSEKTQGFHRWKSEKTPGKGNGGNNYLEYLLSI